MRSSFLYCFVRPLRVSPCDRVPSRKTMMKTSKTSHRCECIAYAAVTVLLCPAPFEVEHKVSQRPLTFSTIIKPLIHLVQLYSMKYFLGNVSIQGTEHECLTTMTQLASESAVCDRGQAFPCFVSHSVMSSISRLMQTATTSRLFWHLLCDATGYQVGAALLGKHVASTGSSLYDA